MHISISWIRNRGLIIAKHIRTWFWGQLGLVSCSNNEIMTYHWRSCISIKDHHWPDIVVHNHFRSLMLVHSGCLLSIKPEILAEKTHLRPHWVTRLEWHLRIMQRRKVFRKCTSNTLSWYWRPVQWRHGTVETSLFTPLTCDMCSERFWLWFSIPVLVLLACVILPSPLDSCHSLLGHFSLRNLRPERFRTVLRMCFHPMSVLIWQDKTLKPHKTELARQKEKQLLKELGILGGGWGPYCSQLEREDRQKLSAREKVKLDVEFAKLKLASKDKLADLLLGSLWLSLHRSCLLPGFEACFDVIYHMICR